MGRRLDIYLPSFTSVDRQVTIVVQHVFAFAEYSDEFEGEGPECRCSREGRTAESRDGILRVGVLIGRGEIAPTIGTGVVGVEADHDVIEPLSAGIQRG